MKVLRRLGYALAIVAALAGAALVFVKVRYGGGVPYPGVATPPSLPDPALSRLVTLEFPPGNVAVASDGRVFFSYHPFARADRFGPATMFELVDGKPVPFPDAAFQKTSQGVFGMTVDRQQRLWLIEPAGLDHESTRIIAIDIVTRAMVFQHRFPKGEVRFGQDLRVSPDGNTVYIADTGLFQFTQPGLVVFDVARKLHRNVLTQHPSTQPQNWVTRTPRGPHKLGFGLVTFSVGLDGIELSQDGAWLYYAAMNHDTLYRVPTAALTDANLTPGNLEAKIETVGKKPLSDGITIDREGRIILTDVENGGLVRIDRNGNAQTLVSNRSIVWADGVVVGNGGTILFTDSAIPSYIDQLARPPSLARLTEGRPYAIWKVTAQ